MPKGQTLQVHRQRAPKRGPLASQPHSVLEWAHQLDIAVVEDDLQTYDLCTSNAVFFSRTGPCVLPVTKVDNRAVADGEPGPITQQLLAAWSEAVGVDIVGQTENLASR